MKLSSKALINIGIIAAATLTTTPSHAFTNILPSSSTRNIEMRHSHTIQTLSSSSSSSSSDIDIDALNLTPQLLTMTKAFSSIPDEKLRYKQLLYMANQLQPLDPSLMKPENKVPGCLSTVYVDCTPETKTNSDGSEEVVLNYVGDSDGLLTKGLVALLVRGLSGCTSQQIERVDPEFINAAKITQSLTPGRNNGFLNMLAVMKAKARQYSNDEVESSLSESESTESIEEEESEAEAEAKAEAQPEETQFVSTFDEIAGKPMYNTMMTSLLKLKPTSIQLIDESDQHAGHAGSKGWEESGESHFNLSIVADAFEGLSLVKRHQLIYLVLGGSMDKIHALSIKAKSPSEV